MQDHIGSNSVQSGFAGDSTGHIGPTSFYGLKGLPSFFTKQMSTFFKTLIEQGFALVYIDDIFFLSDSKEHMFQLIEQVHVISVGTSLQQAMKVDSEQAG